MNAIGSIGSTWGLFGNPWGRVNNRWENARRLGEIVLPHVRARGAMPTNSWSRGSTAVEGAGHVDFDA